MSGSKGGVSMSQTRYEGLHDLPALKYKPGAPFKHWKKPPALAALEKPLSAHPDAPSHSSRFYGPDRSTAWTRSSSLVRMPSDQAPAMLQSLCPPQHQLPPPCGASGRPLPIPPQAIAGATTRRFYQQDRPLLHDTSPHNGQHLRSEEHTSELQS